MAQQKLLFLFDGHALIHRAFHALPLLSTKEGEPSGAVYGFASMLLKVLEEFKPSHWAVAFDSAAPTFRHIQFPDYKAQRPKAPDELTSQFRRVRELVHAFNIPTFEVEGHEADDILGTLCDQANAQGIRTIIITGDTDTLQLVSPTVQVLLPRPKRPFSDTQIYDEKAVEQRYGLQPRQIPDLKGIKGDPSDNIPGVPGIGEKTTVKLIQEFGSVEEIYKRIDEVAPMKVQGILRANEKIARQSKELASIVTNVPVSLELDSCRVSSYDRDKVIELFRELEFSSLLGKLPEWIVEEKPVQLVKGEITTNYQIVDTSGSLDDLMQELSEVKTFSIDTETTGKEARQAELVGISLSTAPGKAWYIPVGHEEIGPQLPLSQVVAKIKPFLEDSKVPKIAHNGKYDMAIISQYGLEMKNLDFDTMIAAWLLGEKALGLKPLAFSKLGIEMTPISDLIGSGSKQKSIAEVSIPRVADYACADADMAFRLSQLFEPELKEQGLWKLFREVEMPLVPVLFQMEENGVALDLALLHDMSESIGQEMLRIEAEIHNWAGHKFNINSTQQLSKVIFEELKLTPPRKGKSGSTSAAVLEELRGTHPIIENILGYRQLAKLKSTYIDALPALVDFRIGRIHTNFNQTGTATGRLSSSEPNLQNIPIRTEEGRKIRQAFMAPRDGFLLLSADYSQIELRVMAHLSQDTSLLAAFAKDEDIHTATASQLFGVATSGVTPEMRRVAKTVNFGVIYGISDYGLEQATGLSRQEAADFINAYFQKYNGVKDYVNSTKKQAVEKGYVQTILGRKRYIHEINSSNVQARQAAERMAINMPVQGTAADIMKLAMIKLQKRIDDQGIKSKMILQVHDELLFEVAQEEVEGMKKLALEIMPRALELSLPLKTEIKLGRNWGEME